MITINLKTEDYNMRVEIIFMIFIIIVTALSIAGTFYEKNRNKKNPNKE